MMGASGRESFRGERVDVLWTERYDHGKCDRIGLINPVSVHRRECNNTNIGAHGFLDGERK